MKLCLVLSLLLATGLARHWRTGRSRLGRSRLGRSRPRLGPSRPGISRPGPSRPGAAGPSRPGPPRPRQGSEGGVKPPPPPTDNRIGATANRQNSKYVWDENCKDDRPPFGEGRWIRVTSDECPVAFEDPRFSFYDSFCRSGMSEQHREWYSDEVEGVWTYPEYAYCGALPTYLACPALEECGPRG